MMKETSGMNIDLIINDLTNQIANISREKAIFSASATQKQLELNQAQQELQAKAEENKSLQEQLQAVKDELAKKEEEKKVLQDELNSIFEPSPEEE
jgi:chromosome segregation ATPase